MTARKPLVTIGGQLAELPVGDSIDAPVSPVEQATLFLPVATQSHEQVIARMGTMAGQSVRVWLGATVDSDENELWQLEGVTLSGLCELNQITFFFSSLFLESGPIKIDYQVQ
jgi:hypothetical protein